MNTSEDFFFLACVNGLASRIIQSINQTGWADALFNTFEISAIVLISCIAGVSLIFRDRTVGVRPLELALGAGCVFLVMLPIGPISWIAVTALSLYILASTELATSRRGAFILLATTVPMLWSRILFQFFARPILTVDATLVSLLLRTHRTGRIVDFADGSAREVILPACSSLANISLAVLCWVTLSELVCHRKSIYDIFWCLLACVSVMVVNVTRLCLAGLSEWHYATFHDDKGWTTAFNAITLGAIVGICALGVRRELFHRV